MSAISNHHAPSATNFCDRPVETTRRKKQPSRVQKQRQAGYTPIGVATASNETIHVLCAAVTEIAHIFNLALRKADRVSHAE